MNRQEAERLYESGKETVIETLMSFAAQVRQLEQSIAALTRNSSNSSRPPSSDPPGMKKAKGKKKSKRKQGGQPGHKGKNRKLLPPEEMDKIHDIFPEHCEHCRNPLSDTLVTPFTKPVRHQVFDLPVIIPTKEEYRCHSLLCQSGAVCNAARRVSDACVPAVGRIKQYVASALTLNIDETGWKYKGKRRFLWTFVAPRAVLFHVSPSRGAKVIREVLGETFDGIITSDDHSAYGSYHKNGLRQLCWAHIIRKLKALKEDRSSPHAYCFARTMLRDIGAIFSRWHAFQKSPGSRKQLWLDTGPMRERMNDFCIIFRYSSDPRVETRAKRLLDNWHHLFTFL
jgi:transposase